MAEKLDDEGEETRVRNGCTRVVIYNVAVSMHTHHTPALHLESPRVVSGVSQTRSPCSEPGMGW